MHIYEVFQNADYRKVWEIVKYKHPIFLSDSFLENNEDDKSLILENAMYTIFDTLQLINETSYILDDSIIMIVVKVNDELSSYLVEKDDVLNHKDNIIIWSIDENSDCVKTFGYNFISWSEILGYELCPKSEELDINEIAAEIFCEMTRFGFNEKDVQRTGEKISIDLAGLNMGEEINKARNKNQNYDKWFDKLCDKMHISRAPVEYYQYASEEKIIKKNSQKVHIEFLNTIK